METRERWERRVANVTRTYAEVVDGVMNGHGPLGGLAQMLENERMKGIITEIAPVAQSAINEIGTGEIRCLEPDTRDALETWGTRCKAVVDTPNEHPVQYYGIGPRTRRTLRPRPARSTTRQPSPKGRDGGPEH